MYATQFSQDFPNNQHGLPDEIGQTEDHCQFNHQLCTAFTYDLLQQLWIRNFDNNALKCCVFKNVMRGRLPC